MPFLTTQLWSWRNFYRHSFSCSSERLASGTLTKPMRTCTEACSKCRLTHLDRVDSCLQKRNNMLVEVFISSPSGRVICGLFSQITCRCVDHSSSLVRLDDITISSHQLFHIPPPLSEKDACSIIICPCTVLVQKDAAAIVMIDEDIGSRFRGYLWNCHSSCNRSARRCSVCCITSIVQDFVFLLKRATPLRDHSMQIREPGLLPGIAALFQILFQVLQYLWGSTVREVQTN